MINKAMLIILVSTSSCKVDNINKSSVVYHQILPAEECEKIAEQLRSRPSQGAVCVPMEASHE